MFDNIKDIENLIKKPLSDMECGRLSLLNKVTEAFRAKNATFAKHLNGAYYTSIRSENDVEYKYYLTPTLGILDFVIKRLCINSIIDLGSGLGDLMFLLESFTEISVAGIEKDEKLIEYSLIDTLNKDLLDISCEDIKSFDAIYLWEPISGNDMCRTFMNNLLMSVKRGQIIIYRQSGQIIDYLYESDKLEECKLDDFSFKNINGIISNIDFRIFLVK